MNLILKLSVVFLLIFTESCDSSKAVSSSDETETKESKTMGKELLANGYSTGIVKVIEGSKCPFIIYDERTKAQFDPINMDDSKYASFKEKDAKIYYKFLPLRMKNRCNEAQPITLADIKKREN